MAKTPNYQFEKKERERAKANKAADRADAKREQRERARAEAAGQAPPTDSEPTED